MVQGSRSCLNVSPSIARAVTDSLGAGNGVRPWSAAISISDHCRLIESGPNVDADLTLHSAVPIVPLIFPVPAAALREKIDFGQILHVLVAELDGRVEAQRGAMIGI